MTQTLMEGKSRVVGSFSEIFFDRIFRQYLLRKELNSLEPSMETINFFADLAECVNYIGTFILNFMQQK